jgi:hypothetical protein
MPRAGHAGGMRPKRIAELAEGQLQILAVVFNVRIAHEVQEPRVIQKDDARETLRRTIGPDCFPLGPSGRKLAQRPTLHNTLGVGYGDNVGKSFPDHEASARKLIEGRPRLRAVVCANHHQARAPRGRGERSGQDPRVLILSREHPEGVHPGGLESASVSEQLADIAT